MLQDPANRQRSLLILAHDAGFGSKSALYAAFFRSQSSTFSNWSAAIHSEPFATSFSTMISSAPATVESLCATISVVRPFAASDIPHVAALCVYPAMVRVAVAMIV